MSFTGDLARAVNHRVEERVDLSARTSVRVGGPAQLLARPETERELCDALDLCAQRGMPWVVLGAGTNVIVSDGGVRGVVIRLGQNLAPERVELEGESATFTLSGGAPMARLLALAKAKSCVGAEFWAGIPGTIGGGVVMNAGTKAGSTEHLCEEVGVVEPGQARRLTASGVGFAYRRTALPERAVVTWAKFRLRIAERAEVERLQRAVEEDMVRRRTTQPLALPNFGSVFRNPPGDYAGRMVQACGLRGLREGDAQISELHANFIVNRGKARASQVLGLMRRMQDAVLGQFGVLLVPEVKLLGEFDPALLPRGIEHVQPAA
jgi:UDP-N-acetylmuramate dehydrogenase